MPFDLTIHNVGNVDSIGNVIFLAGTTRYAAANATFMFHGVGIDVQAPIRLEEQSLNDYLAIILSDQTKMGDIIADRSRIKREEIAELFRTQQTQTADWALQRGIIEDIRDFNIPPGSPVLSFVIQR